MNEIRNNIDRHVQTAMLMFLQDGGKTASVRDVVVRMMQHVDDEEMQDFEVKAEQWGYGDSYDSVVNMLVQSTLERFGDVDDAWNWAVTLPINKAAENPF